jgi:hypothetical protein
MIGSTVSTGVIGLDRTNTPIAPSVIAAIGKAMRGLAHFAQCISAAELSVVPVSVNTRTKMRRLE